MRWLAAAVAVAALGGCSDVDIVARCEIAGDVLPVVSAARAPRSASVAKISADELVLWDELRQDAELPWVEQRAAWVVGGALASESVLGRSGYSYRNRWVRDGDLLRGQTWSYLGDELIPGFQDDVLIWEAVPRQAPSSSVATPALLSPACPECNQPVIAGHAPSPGGQAGLPAASSSTAAVAALIGAPSICGPGRASGDLFRLVLLDMRTGSSAAVLWSDEPCAAGVPDLWVSNPWLVGLPDGSFAALFRTGYASPGLGDGGLRIARVMADATLIEGPYRIGPEAAAPEDTGYQPRAALVGGNRILFTDRPGVVYRCPRLRIVDLSSYDYEDTPWQLPCSEDAAIRTRSLDILSWRSHALVVWSETRPFRDDRFVYYPGELSESVRAAIVTSGGDRGSDVLTLSAGDTTTLPIEGGYPGDLLPSAAMDGDDAAVVWQDARPSAPGVQLRRLVCRASD